MTGRAGHCPFVAGPVFPARAMTQIEHGDGGTGAI